MKTKSAFTIIEMSLTISFISILLITIALLIVNITGTYQKGLSIRSVNTVGEELVDEFSHAIASSASKNTIAKCGKNTACKGDGGRKFTWHSYDGSYDLATYGSSDTTATDVPMHGVFCTGRYSYIYRTGYGINSNLAVYLEYKDSSGNTAYYPSASTADESKAAAAGQKSGIRLLKVSDPSRYLCVHRTAVDETTYQDAPIPASSLPLYQKTDANIPAPTELLSSSDDDLALYDLVIFDPLMNSITQQNFISGTFILATVRGGVNIMGNGNYCTEPPDNLATDFNYCAINKFNFAMRATGQLTTEERKDE